MRSRPLPVTVAVILLVLLSLFGIPWLWTLLFPRAEQPPTLVVLYTGLVLGIVGLGVAVGLWMMRAWSYWATIVVCVLNVLSGVPGVVAGPTAGIRATSAVFSPLLAIALLYLPSW